MLLSIPDDPGSLFLEALLRLSDEATSMFTRLYPNHHHQLRVEGRLAWLPIRLSTSPLPRQRLGAVMLAMPGNGLMNLLSHLVL